MSVQVLIGAISPSPPPAPPPPPGQGAYLENLFSGMCLDTRGRRMTPGATIDQYTCVSANNEQYAYDTGTGHFVGACVNLQPKILICFYFARFHKYQLVPFLWEWNRTKF